MIHIFFFLQEKAEKDFYKKLNFCWADLHNKKTNIVEFIKMWYLSGLYSRIMIHITLKSGFISFSGCLVIRPTSEAEVADVWKKNGIN